MVCLVKRGAVCVYMRGSGVFRADLVTANAAPYVLLLCKRCGQQWACHEAGQLCSLSCSISTLHTVSTCVPPASAYFSRKPLWFTHSLRASSST